MEEQPYSGSEPEKNAAAETDWEERKRQAQTDFGMSADNRVTIDRIHVQRLLNAKFWEKEILHEQLGDLTKDDREHQLDQGIEPER